jgi:hypothetical protein
MLTWYKSCFNQMVLHSICKIPVWKVKSDVGNVWLLCRKKDMVKAHVKKVFLHLKLLSIYCSHFVAEISDCVNYFVQLILRLYASVTVALVNFQCSLYPTKKTLFIHLKVRPKLYCFSYL